MSKFSREKVIEYTVAVLRKAGWSQIEVEDRGRKIFVVVGTEGSSEQYIEEPMSKLLRAAYALGGPELYSIIEEYDVEPTEEPAPFPAESRVGQLVNGYEGKIKTLPVILFGWDISEEFVIEVEQNLDTIQAAYPAKEGETMKEALEKAFVQAQSRLGRRVKAPVQTEGSPKSSYQSLNTLVAEQKLIRRPDGYYISHRSGRKIQLVHTELGLTFSAWAVKSKGYFSKLWKARLVEEAGIL